jgi:hypothetical protein
LSARLGPEAALQYLYRFSPLAEQLRLADLGLSEAEFRQAFAALLELETAPGDPPTFGAARASLRRMLGDARFTRLWAARDPLFGVFEHVGKQHSLADSAVLSAYEIFNDAQDRLAETAARYAGVDSVRAGEAMRGVQTDMQQRLAGLVGDEAASAFLSATAQAAAAMREQSSANR